MATEQKSRVNRPSVVIIGGGFGGLHAAKELRKTAVDVTLVDRNNYHLFQPLLYQVATGGLSPANIAAPLRSIFRRQSNLEVLQAEVIGFDIPNHRVLMDGDDLAYDYLIVAAGATHSYFGRKDWEPLAPGLKTLKDATEIRSRVLSAFERAERTDDVAKRKKLLTFVIVGGGPTGVELAGALSELSRHTLKHDFRKINPEDARIILVDATQHVLSVYPEELSKQAAKQLARLEITTFLGRKVIEISHDHVVLESVDGSETIESETVLWAAGVAASPLAIQIAQAIGVEVDRAGRIPVGSDLSLVNHPEIMVIGDMAICLGANGKSLPGVAPVAIQQGNYAAKRIQGLLKKTKANPFKYRDYGSMATIGRSAAVVSMGWFKSVGIIAWIIWLFIHLMQLVSFQNRLLVLFQWAWSYFTHGRSARLITEAKETQD